MSTKPHQEAIQQLIRQRNPFHANPVLKLRHPGLRHLWHHPRLRQYHRQLAAFAFNATERFTKYLLVITTLSLGFVLAALLIALPLAIALYLLKFNLNEISLRLVTEQSWPNYSSWLLISSTLFCLPYWCWGLPLALTLRYYRPLHHWYTRRRLQAQLQAIHCDDPAYLSAQIARHPLMTGRVRPSPRVVHSVETSGKIIGTITGTLAVSLCLILFVKLIPLLWQHGQLGQSLVIFLGCPAGLYLPILLFRSFRSGQAVTDLVMALLRGSSYGEAMMAALADFWTHLFEGW